MTSAGCSVSECVLSCTRGGQWIRILLVPAAVMTCLLVLPYLLEESGICTDAWVRGRRNQPLPTSRGGHGFTKSSVGLKFSHCPHMTLASYSLFLPQGSACGDIQGTTHDLQPSLSAGVPAGSPAEREVARGVRQLEPKVPRDHVMKGKVPGTD